jgi:hypothetical protein
MDGDVKYGPGYVRWAADHETDRTRQDLAVSLLLTEN